jgi:hypothetical protein
VTPGIDPVVVVPEAVVVVVVIGFTAVIVGGFAVVANVGFTVVPGWFDPDGIKPDEPGGFELPEVGGEGGFAVMVRQ